MFVTYVNEALLALADRHNVTTPLSETVEAITERVYRELEVLQAVGDSVSRSDLDQRVELPAEEIDEAIRSLETKGVVTVEDDRVIKESTTL